MRLTLARNLAFATALILAPASATAQESTILREASSVAWPVPAFPATGNPQCDADGNLYFKASLGLTDTGLTKVAHDGSKNHFYKSPGADADSKYYQFSQFNVTPSGDVRVLARSSSYDAYVFLFDPDFSGASKTKLELPEHLRVGSFAAFESGTILVTGYFDEHADKKAQGKSYAALFQASGKLKIVVAGRFANVDLASVRKKLSEGGAALGEDGFLYLLRPDEIVVISESGTIVRRMPFKKPNPELLAVRALVSGGLVVVDLLKSEALGKEFKAQFLVLNASTGERVGLYEPEPALGNTLLCFSRSTGFAFLSMRDDRVMLSTAPLR